MVQGRYLTDSLRREGTHRIFKLRNYCGAGIHITQTEMPTSRLLHCSSLATPEVWHASQQATTNSDSPEGGRAGRSPWAPGTMGPHSVYVWQERPRETIHRFLLATVYVYLRKQNGRRGIGKQISSIKSTVGSSKKKINHRAVHNSNFTVQFSRQQKKSHVFSAQHRSAPRRSHATIFD